MGINKDSISDQIYNLIKNKILLQEIEMGTQIETKSIAEQHNISVMPVRDALKKLTNQGLVERRSRVGFFVRTFSLKEISEIMEARKMYEVYSIDSHFASIDRNEIKKLIQPVKEKNYLAREEFDKVDDEFHDILVKATENDYIIDKYNQLKDIIILFRHLDKNRIDKANNEHEEIATAITNNEKARAKELLIHHLEKVTQAILNNVRDKEFVMG